MAKEICLRAQGDKSWTAVPNFFIDTYMTKANGAYVKVYLYLLRCLEQPGMGFRTDAVAAAFGDTEGDVLRALTYWETMGLLRLSFDEEQNIIAIDLVRDPQAKEEPVAPKTETVVPDNVRRLPTKPTYTKKQLAAFCAQEEIEQLLYICERYLGRGITQADTSYLLYWHNELRFSADLIECLIELVVSAKGREKITSFRYLQNVAENWFEQGISTPIEAKKYMKRSDSFAMQNVVMNALGIKGRTLVADEIAMVQKWAEGWGFTAELISEACRRTIANTHEPSLSYTESILANWRKQGISSMEDVQHADEEFQNRKAAEFAARKSSRSTKKNEGTTSNLKQFYTCPSRDYDYDELAKQLLRQS